MKDIVELVFWKHYWQTRTERGREGGRDETNGVVDEHFAERLAASRSLPSPGPDDNR